MQALGFFVLVAVACSNEEKEELQDPENLNPEDKISCLCRECFFCAEAGKEPTDPNCNEDDRVEIMSSQGTKGIECVDPNECMFDASALAQQCLDACVSASKIIAACDDIEVDECTEFGCEANAAPSPLAGASLAYARPTDSFIELDNLASRAILEFDDLVDEAPAFGSLWITGCESTPCEIQIHFAQLAAGQFEFEECDPFPPFCDAMTVNDAEATLATTMTATLDASAAISIDSATAVMHTSFDVDGDAHGSTRLEPVGSPTGVYDPGTGEFQLAGTWQGKSATPYEDMRLTLDLVGRFENLAPDAVAGPDRLLECASAGSATALLNGSASSDAEAPIADYVWTSQSPVTSLARTVQTSVDVPAGTERTFELIVVDDFGAIDSDQVVVGVVDTTAPQLEPVTSLAVCVPKVQLHSVAPAVTEDCFPSTVVLEGWLLAVDGTAILPPIEILDGQLDLRPGEYTLSWRAEDEEGNVSTLTHDLEVELLETTVCCASGREIREGGPAQDFIAPPPGAAYCLLGYELGDHLVSPGHDDVLIGGPGGDHLTSGEGNDLLLGGEGADALHGGLLGGVLEAYGGPGADFISASSSDASWLYGGPGDDALFGSPGDDVLVPGVGVDFSFGGLGDDTVVIYDLCEVEAGESIDGGHLGFDTLRTPVPLAELQAAGAFVTGFEQVILDTSRRHLALCF